MFKANKRFMAQTFSITFITAALALSAHAHNDGERLNINLATAEQIDNTLVFVGKNTAQNIVDYRNENGDFRNLQEFAKVEGVSKRLARYNRSRISFD